MQWEQADSLQPGILSSPGNQPSSLRFLSPVSCPTPVKTRNPSATVHTPSLEWDCNSSTTQLEERESIHGIWLLGNRTSPIVSTEESTLRIESFNTPGREKPVERRALLHTMDQQEMVNEMSTLKGRIAKLALMIVNRLGQLDDSQMEALSAKLNEGYANFLGEFETWKRKYAEVMDDDIYEEIKQDLECVLTALFA